MVNSIDFYRRLADALTQGPVVVATVIRTSGSAPREVGARLMVTDRGLIGGTIGGGAGEARVLQAAKTVLQTGIKQRVAIDLSGLPQRDTQGICGGQMQVWVERWAGTAALALTQQIVGALEQGQAVVLHTPLVQELPPFVQPGPGQPSLVPPNPASLSPGPPPSLIEVLQPPPTLLIVGAGHCGIQLAQVASLIGFQVMVQDDRPDWANADNFPQAQGCFTQPITTVVDRLADHPQLYVALVTRGFEYDLAALQALLQRPRPCPYIGMIGSQLRVQRVLQALQAQGVPQARLTCLHAPIGLDIGAQTPAEIAISISAELILVRRGGTGQSLSRGSGSGGVSTSLEVGGAGGG